MTEGERWTREELDRLRRGRFSAAAIVHFLAASFARARETRERRPALALQSRRWGLLGLLASAPLGPATSLRWLCWWAMLEWHLGMVESGSGAPRPLRACDALSLGRLWLAALVRRRPRASLITLAAASDVLDGRLARRAGATRLGRDLDSAADVTFFLATLEGLVADGRLSWRVPAAERARLVLGAAGGVATYFGASTRPRRPEQPALPAVLGCVGMLLAAAGGERGRALAEPLLACSIGARTVLGLRAMSSPPAAPKLRAMGRLPAVPGPCTSSRHLDAAGAAC